MKPLRQVAHLILDLRGRKVLIDADLAAIYGVETRVLNQAIRRNRDRFPRDFMFTLTPAEKEKVITICDHLAPLRFAKSLPLAFTVRRGLRGRTSATH